MKRGADKGVTLVELSITIMLVAVVALMVISFSTVMSGITDNSAYMRKSLGEITVLKSSTSDWVAYFDSSDYSLSADTGSVYAADALGNRYRIGYRDGSFVAEYPDHTVELTFETVNSAWFDIARSLDSGTALVRCTANYYQVVSSFGNKQIDKTIVFCCAKRSVTTIDA